jgi:hypothetical protein
MVNHLPHNHSASQLRKSLRLGSSQSLSFSHSVYTTHREAHNPNFLVTGVVTSRWSRNAVVDDVTWLPIRWFLPFHQGMLKGDGPRRFQTLPVSFLKPQSCWIDGHLELTRFRISLEGTDLCASIVRRLSHVWVFRCCSWERRGWQPLSVILWRGRPIAVMGLPHELQINESNYEQP